MIQNNDPINSISKNDTEKKGEVPDKNDCCYKGNPTRPGKKVGISRDRLKDFPSLTPADLTTKNPPNSWAGQRKDLYLPFIFLRSHPGDLGTRPVTGPFWESPDILIMSGIEPASAPTIPPELGLVALADKPNTLYAHIWNFGLAQAPQVVVEFYWCDPSLGIGAQSAHLIGQTVISLGAYGSGHAHALAKCPVAWKPSFLNGGLECLVVRAWDYTSDSLGTPAWDAKLNRHIGLRNIHVIQTASISTEPDIPPAIPVDPDSEHNPTFEAIIPYNTAKIKAPDINASQAVKLNMPLRIKIGPLFGMPAQVSVKREAPHSMPWLQLHTGVNGKFPMQAIPSGNPVLSAPTSIGGGLSVSESASIHNVTGDDQQIFFNTTDAPPKKGEAHIYRITISQGGETVGGYTVVLIGA